MSLFLTYQLIYLQFICQYFIGNDLKLNSYNLASLLLLAINQMKYMAVFIIAIVMLLTSLTSEATTVVLADMFSRESTLLSSEVLTVEADTDNITSASGVIVSAMAHTIVFGYNNCPQDYDILLSLPCGVCMTAFGVSKRNTCFEIGETSGLNSNMFASVLIPAFPSNYDDNVFTGLGNDFIYDSIDIDSASVAQNTASFRSAVYEAVPVSEPSSMLLIGMGLMGIDAFRRTLRKK